MSPTDSLQSKRQSRPKSRFFRKARVVGPQRRGVSEGSRRPAGAAGRAGRKGAAEGYRSVGWRSLWTLPRSAAIPGGGGRGGAAQPRQGRGACAGRCCGAARRMSSCSVRWGRLWFSSSQEGQDLGQRPALHHGLAAAGVQRQPCCTIAGKEGSQQHRAGMSQGPHLGSSRDPTGVPCIFAWPRRPRA